MASRRAVRGLARMCASMSTSALTNTTGMRTEVMHTRTVCSLPHGFSRDVDVWQGRSRPQSSSASLTHSRALSNKPYDSVYGGPKPPNDRVTLRRLMQKYRAGERISVVTAYDYPSAVAVDQSGIDVLLVGDSAAMVVHGHDTTLPITLEEMLTHCRAVARGAQRPLLVGDLPFGSYEQSPGQAVASATRMLKEGSMDAVKLEGGSAGRIITVQTLVDAGIAVMGHVGLTPQSISVLGGFRPQGRTLDEAASVVDKALALQNAGCFAIVLECVPRSVAAAVTEALDIPTIGIGAGDQTSGQVLVYHDLLGFTAHPHHKKVTPKFSKQYADVGTVIAKALEQFKNEVHAGTFPSQLHSPYRLGTEDSFLLADRLREKGLGKAADAVLAALEEEKGE